MKVRPVSNAHEDKEVEYKTDRESNEDMCSFYKGILHDESRK